MALSVRSLCFLLELHFILLLIGSFTTITSQYPPRRRGYANDDPGHKKLIVTTTLDEPFMMLKRQAGFVHGNERFEGYLADLLTKLSKYAGFNYEIRLVRDGKLGQAEENGTWSGMIGELQRGESDIAAGPIAVTSQRQQIIEFSAPFMSVRSVALLRKPRRKSKPRRVKIRNVNDLISQRTTLYGVIENGLAQRSLRASKNMIYRRLWTHMANSWPSVFVHNLREGIERARREDYAFILDSVQAAFATGKEPCDLYTTDPFLNERNYALGLSKKNKNLLVPINDAIVRMRTKGELKDLYDKWWVSECSHFSFDASARKRNKNSSPDESSTPLAGMYSSSGFVTNVDYMVLTLMLSSMVWCFATKL